jgi:hypothetical protein
VVIIPRDWAHEEARRQSDYDADRTDKIHRLIQEYVDTHPLVCGADPEIQIRECKEYVENHYGVTGLEFLLWPIIAGAISWLVGRLLDRAYPKDQT